MLTVTTKISLCPLPFNHFTFSCVLLAFRIYTNVSRSDVLFWQEEEHSTLGMSRSWKLSAQLCGQRCSQVCRQLKSTDMIQIATQSLVIAVLPSRITSAKL